MLIEIKVFLSYHPVLNSNQPDAVEKPKAEDDSSETTDFVQS